LQAVAVLVFLAARFVVVRGLALLPDDQAGATMESILGTGARVGFWLWRVVFPVPMGPAADLVPAQGLEAWVAWTGLAAAIFFVAKQESFQRAGLALCLLPLMMVSGLLQSAPRYGDTLTILPLAGLLLALGAAVKRPPASVTFAICMVAGGLAWMSTERLPEWSSAQTLWESAYARSPQDRVLALSVARARLASNPQSALDALDPSVWPSGSRQRREASAVAARACLALGREDEAVVWLGQAVADDPEAAWANAMACVLLAARGSRTAGGICELAVRSSPQDPDVLNAMGITRIGLGGASEALPWFVQAAELAPNRLVFQANRDRAAAAVSGQ
jgi:tetratricopeptide (TPR) repeat protein